MGQRELNESERPLVPKDRHSGNNGEPDMGKGSDNVRVDTANGRDQS
jgi:hypothetical protein